MTIRRRLLVALTVVLMLSVASAATADTIDLDKQLKYVLDSKAIPKAVLQKCCDKTDLSGYPGINIKYNESLLKKEGVAWTVTTTDLPSQMTPNSQAVGTGTIYNCNPSESAEGTTTVDWAVTDTHTVEADVSMDVGTEVSIEGKDEILGTGVDVGLKMSIDFGVSLKEGEKYSQEFSGSQDVKENVAPLSMVKATCSMKTFSFDNHTFKMTMVVGGTISLPTLDYAFKNGPSGHLPGFSFKLEDVLTEEERTVHTTGTLTGQQWLVDATCTLGDTKPMSDQDKKDQCK